MNAKSLCAVGAAIALGLAACGDDDEGEGGTTTGATTEQAAPTGPASGTVSLSEKEFSIDPADAKVDKAGVIEFTVENTGSITHALEVEGAGIEEETEDIAAGDSATLKVDLPDGTYELYCPIDDHKEQGMEAELTVGAGGASSTEDESGEDESGDDNSGGAEAPDDDDNSGGAEAPDDSGY